MGAKELFDREGELAAVAAAAAAAGRGEPAVLLLEGPPGSGKTALLEAAIDAAEQAGGGSGGRESEAPATAAGDPRQPSGRPPVNQADARVVHARCSEAERHFALGAVRQLFEPLLGGAESCPALREALRAGPARTAARVLGSGGDQAQAGAGAGPGGPGARDDRPAAFETLHGIYWLVRNLALQRPLLITVDDLPDADPLSARWLTHTARRLDGLPVLIVATADSDSRSASGDRTLSELRALPYFQALRLGPLRPQSVARLLEASLGRYAVPGTHAGTIGHPLTRGNPQRVLELAAALRDAAAQAPAASPDRRFELGVTRLVQSVLERIGQTCSTPSLPGLASCSASPTGWFATRSRRPCRPRRWRRPTSAPPACCTAAAPRWSWSPGTSWR